jgi:hypothetical protein
VLDADLGGVLDLRRRSAEGLAQRPGRMEQADPALP